MKNHRPTPAKANPGSNQRIHSTSADKKLVARRTGGAATGALVGAVMGGPLGAVVGGAVGLIVGGATATPPIKKVSPHEKIDPAKKARKVKAKAKRAVSKVKQRVKGKV